MSTDPTTLSEDSDTIQKLEDLKATIEEWALNRKFEVYKEVVFLKSLNANVETLTEAAADDALQAASATVEAISGYS
ncbi:MAG: hypothetical protein VXZ72_00760 [Chlamydiota bacterium]|nr:hypothetical protein [Chlamydiota bacterium]